MIVLAIIGYAAFYWVKKEHYVAYSSFSEVLYTLGMIIIGAFAGVIGFGILTTLITWIYFLLTHSESISVKLGIDIKGPLGEAPVRIEIPRAIRPFLGFIKTRLVFDDYNQTSILPLENAVRERRKFFRIGIKGAQIATLTIIQEYKINKVVVLFEDMFQMIQLPFTYKLTKAVYTTPPVIDVEEINIEANRTEQDKLRIQTLKRIQGEYLNYKNFESGDDVRRIVWKIYAKNKELVVRIPEIANPYASHIYFLGSFYKDIFTKNKISFFFLNYYKTVLENIIDSLQKEGVNVRYLPDQEVSNTFQVAEQEKITYSISVAHWQKNNPLSNYIETKGTFLACFSSLTSVEEIEKLMNGKRKDVVLFWVRLSNSFKRRRFVRIKYLFIKRDTTFADRAWQKWIFSSSKRKVIKNEKRIEALLKKNGIDYIEI